MGQFANSIQHITNDSVVYLVKDPVSGLVVHIGMGGHLRRAAEQANQGFPNHPVSFLSITNAVQQAFAMPAGVPSSYSLVGNLERLLQALFTWHHQVTPHHMGVQKGGVQFGGLITSAAMLSDINDLLVDFGGGNARSLPPIPTMFPQNVPPAANAGPGRPQSRLAYPTFWVDLQTQQAHFDYCPLLTGDEAIQYGAFRAHSQSASWPI